MNRRAVSQIAMVFAFVRRGCRHVCVYYTFDTVDYLVLLATVSLSLLRKTGKQSLSSKLPVQLIAARSCKDAQTAEAEQGTERFDRWGFPSSCQKKTRKTAEFLGFLKRVVLC